MFTAEQYRAKAIEYGELARIATAPNAAHEYQMLERSFTELADNAQWVTNNKGKLVQATDRVTAQLAPDAHAQNMTQQ
jgi:hypothetical protein